MTELVTIISTIITTELLQDDVVKANSFVLDPVTTDVVLRGDGKPEEVTTSYQLDFFFEKKGKLVSKTKALIAALSDYCISNVTYRWEDTVRLYRATMRIETI